jgi:hypothetical protein
MAYALSNLRWVSFLETLARRKRIPPETNSPKWAAFSRGVLFRLNLRHVNDHTRPQGAGFVEGKFLVNKFFNTCTIQDVMEHRAGMAKRLSTRLFVDYT